MHILGIDPALSTTGYAIIDYETEKLLEVNKIITKPNICDQDRIFNITITLLNITKKYNVSNVILEDGYLGPNVKTSIQLAMLRGGLINVFKFNDFDVDYMMPTEIRKLFGINGKSNKEQVADRVKEYILNTSKVDLVSLIGDYSDKQNKNKTSDMYDAISISLAFIKKIKGLLNET